MGAYADRRWTVPIIVERRRLRIISDTPMEGFIGDSSEFLPFNTHICLLDFFPSNKLYCLSFRDPLSAILVSCKAAISTFSRQSANSITAVFLHCQFAAGLHVGHVLTLQLAIQPTV